MKIMYETIKYQYKQYVLSSRWVMPLVTLIAVISVMYTVTPVEVVNSFSMMGLFLFAIMAWVGVTTQDVEPEVSEQIMILRLKSARKYYVCHILFLTRLCGISIVISMGIPMLKNILTQNGVFGRGIIWSDMAGGLLLMFACAFTGITTGELFHIRIVKERTISIGVTFFFALLGIIRTGVIEEYPISKYLLWIAPPVSDVVSWFSNAEYFDMGKMAGGFILLMTYGVVFSVVKVELLQIKKF